MNQIITLFDRMDTWRHFPNYQLERRADIFFSLYLSEVLEAKLGFPIRAELTPEFPIRIGTIYPEIPIDKSYKIDYLALSEDAETAVLVELKTEGLSRRAGQDKYLTASQKVGLACLLRGLLDIFRASTSKRKYYSLLLHLETIRLLSLPQKFKDIMGSSTLQGVIEASQEIQITAKTTNTIVVYVQPNGTESDIISFPFFAEVVRTHNDQISQRFATSLCEWAEIPAGEK